MNNNYFCHMVHFDYSLEEKLYTDPESINFTEHFAPLFLEAINLVKIYGLLTKCEVKMAGYWPSYFFCVFIDWARVEVHKLAKKYPVMLTEQAWSIKDLLYRFWGNYSCGTQQARWNFFILSNFISRTRCNFW